MGIHSVMGGILTEEWKSGSALLFRDKF